MSGAPTTPGGTQVTGGVGGSTFGTLSSIGSDLSVSVSFNIANELLELQGEYPANTYNVAILLPLGYVPLSARNSAQLF